ncbi:MAG: hypothetical protein JNL97_01485, partial [Verrucomicrobiales bacterium]|nr:hypothetical protein [Verrucomicrobiales bacterium]
MHSNSIPLPTALLIALGVALDGFGIFARTVHAAVAEPVRLETLASAKRVVFLGDSITYAGEYVEFVETWIRLSAPASSVDVGDVGLPSETVSGLSEDGHAGGAFPRPDLHERLSRVLDLTKPD